MPLAIFIDSSVYLSFFSVSNDDLEQLLKITSLIKRREIQLIIPQHVEREFIRNRDKKLADALKVFEQNSFKMPVIPRFMLDYEETKQLRQHLAAFNKSHKEAIAKARAEASQTSTRADNVIKEIFQTAGIIAETDQIFDRANRRLLLDEPPGKPQSIGDRINWEHVLDAVSRGTDVHIVARDTDFQSSLNDKEPHRSLLMEWTAAKASRLYVHTELKQFLSERFKDFDFSNNIETPHRRSKSQTWDEYEQKIGTLKDYVQKIEAFEQLENASYEEEIIEAIDHIRTILPIMNPHDLKKIVDIGLTSSSIYDSSYNEEIRDFFESLMPRVTPILTRNDLEGLAHIFEIEPNILLYDDEIDPLTPNYAEIELDRLAELLDDEKAKTRR